MAKFIQIYHDLGVETINPEHIEHIEIIRLGSTKDKDWSAKLDMGMISGKKIICSWSFEEYGRDSWELVENSYEALTGLSGEDA